MKVVKVYGPLRKYLGQCRFEFVADTPAQAMKALCVNFPGLAQWLLDREAEGMAFRVTRGRDKITNEAPEGLALPWSEREVFSIAPVIVGAGRGIGQILLGAVLIGAAFISFGASAAFAGVLAPGGTFGGALAAGATLAPFASNALFAIGASLVLGGVAQMISPMPDLGFNTGKEAARLESFTFSGIVNTSKQGMAVPICYGRAFVGSAVISSGLDVDQVAV
jgi:predicted phage tail protein